MKVQLQIACDKPQRFEIPDAETFGAWANETSDLDTEAVVRVVDEDEARSLNKRHRKSDKPTNVLAFPYEPLLPDEPSYLGDIVIAAPLVVREAGERGVGAREHWALLFIHALLHLLGYDHERDADAERMQKRETEILTRLGMPSPWASS